MQIGDKVRVRNLGDYIVHSFPLLQQDLVYLSTEADYPTRWSLMVKKDACTMLIDVSKILVSPGTEDLLVQRFKLTSAMDSALRSMRNGRHSFAEYTLAEALGRKLTPEPEDSWKEKYEELLERCTCQVTPIQVGDLLAGGKRFSNRGVDEWYDFPRYRVVGFHYAEPKMFVETINDSGKVIGTESFELGSTQYKKVPMTWYKRGVTK